MRDAPAKSELERLRRREALEREFAGARLVTGKIAAEEPLPESLWAKRYTQDVPRLLDEVERLRQREAALRESLEAFVRRYGERCQCPECVQARAALEQGEQS